MAIILGTKTSPWYTIVVERHYAGSPPVYLHAGIWAATAQNAAWITMAIGGGHALCERIDGKSILVAHQRLCTPDSYVPLQALALGLPRDTPHPMSLYGARHSTALKAAIASLRIPPIEPAQYLIPGFQQLHAETRRRAHQDATSWLDHFQNQPHQ